MRRFQIVLSIFLILITDIMVLQAESYKEAYESGRIVVIENSRYSRCFVSANAEYLGRNHEIAASEGFFSYFIGNGKPLKANISIDSDFRRGGVITEEVTTAPDVDRIRSVLRDENGREVCGNLFFRINGRWVGMLGIPSYIKRGSYKLDIEGWNGTGHFIFKRKVVVGGNAFQLDVIRLSEALTSLRERDDRRIHEETKKLLSIIRSFDANAIFAYPHFVFPVKGRITGRFGGSVQYS